MVVKETRVREVFEAIQDKYDLLDSIMSFGLDQPWRKRVIRSLELSDEMVVLDSGAGTGKLTKMIKETCSNCRIISLDITEKMFRPSLLSGVEFVVGSAEKMPFEVTSIDRAASCFLTRNLSDLEKYFAELKRVLKPGGIFVNLDIYPPQNHVFGSFFSIYFYSMVPRLGDFLTRSDAYSYLAESVRNFITPSRMTEILSESGFSVLEERHMGLGTVVIHKAVKE